jgi:hypothetical protein
VSATARSDPSAAGTSTSLLAAAVAAWLVAVLATQAWPSWSTGIRNRFASDVSSYEQIAKAAPGLPSGSLPQQHAERFPAHWLVGTVSDLTGWSLHGVYRAASLLCLLALVAVVAATLERLRLDLAGQVVALGLLMASAYPFRYLLAAPGMVSDAVFLLGLAVTVLGLTTRRDATVVGGLLVATAGRQTAVPVALAVAAILAFRRRFALAAVSAVLPLTLYGAERAVADRFGDGGLGGAQSVLAAAGHPRELADHVGRIVLPLVVPLAVAAGAWMRTRVPPSLAPTVVATAVVLQPLVLDPTWVARNEPRLAGLALPAVVVALATPLAACRLQPLETAMVSLAILAGSLHARYSDVGVPRSAAWVGLEVVAAAVAFAVLARARLGAATSRRVATE